MDKFLGTLGGLLGVAILAFVGGHVYGENVFTAIDEATKKKAEKKEAAAGEKKD